MEITEVRLHEHPDLDAIAAYWLAKKFGQKAFSGIEKAIVTFWPQQSMSESAEDLEAKGIICFDVGEGRFDHHPHGKCLDKCATDLVAEHLKIHEDIALQRVLDYIRLQDLEGPTSCSRDLRSAGLDEEMIQKASLLESFSFVNTMANMRSDKDSTAFVKLVTKHLDIFYRRQLHFWTTVQEEFKKEAKISSVVSNGKIYKIVLIETETREVGSFSRTREGGGCAVCVHRTPETGHTFISGRLKSEQFMEIAKVLRTFELNQRSISASYNLPDLEESRMDLCPVWYVPKNRYGEIFIIINGGEKAKEVEPSVLSLDYIKLAIEIGLREEQFPKACPQSSCLGTSCDYYPFGLIRCHNIRQQGS